MKLFHHIIPYPLKRTNVLSLFLSNLAISFERLCELAGKASIPYWTSDLVTKEVTYYADKSIPLLVEPIPGL